MKISFDTDKYFHGEDTTSTDLNNLGQMLMLFIQHHGVYPETNVFPENDGWIQRIDTPRSLLVALMGDSVYDHRRHWTHLYHIESGLHVLWHHDGDLSILFDNQGPGSFALSNAGSSLQRWELESLEDPRNDPAYDPFV